MNILCDECDSSTEPITFQCQAPEAGTVFLIGEFNDWNPSTHPMHRQADGSWVLQLPLAHGRHYYQFLVDGKPRLDSHAMYVALENRHENVSFIAFD